MADGVLGGDVDKNAHVLSAARYALLHQRLPTSVYLRQGACQRLPHLPMSIWTAPPVRMEDCNAPARQG